MTTTFIGIDLAWQSDKNHTGIVVARGDESGATADVASAGIASLDGVVAFVREHATENTVIAVDAPLIIRNHTGQRPCETEVSRRFAAQHAGAHSTNLSKYPDAPPCRLVEMLQAIGFEHAPRPHTTGVREGRWLFEVYPHPAQVNLFSRDRIIRYKKGTIAEKRDGLVHLRNYLSVLSGFDPWLLPSDEVNRSLFRQELWRLQGRQLKELEDLFDAYFCAYLALYYWRFGVERSELIGDLQTGYIVVPKRPTAPVVLDEDSRDFVSPARFIVDETRIYEMTARFGTHPAGLRWMPEEADLGRSIAWAQYGCEEREHGLGLQRIDVDTEEELRGWGGMVGEFVLKTTNQRRGTPYIEPADPDDVAALPERVMMKPRHSKKTTEPGYVNRNQQVVLTRTEQRGSDHGQWVYMLRCLPCGNEYGANGSDIFQRKCPRCQGGAAGEAVS